MSVVKSGLALNYPPWEWLPAAIGPAIQRRSRLEATPTGGLRLLLGLKIIRLNEFV